VATAFALYGAGPACVVDNGSVAIGVLICAWTPGTSEMLVIATIDEILMKCFIEYPLLRA